MSLNFANRLAIGLTSISLPAATAIATWFGAREASAVAELAYNDCMVASASAPSMAAACAIESQAASINSMAESIALRWANGLFYITVIWFAVLAIYLLCGWIMRGRCDRST